MRLLQRVGEGAFKLTTELTGEEIPQYAILSHTWLLDNDREVTYEDFVHGETDGKAEGWAKIRFCSEQAAQDGLDYFWLDTCCINKQNAVEVQEAIIAMFSWYRNATRCYVYLSDISLEEASRRDGSTSSHPQWWESSFRRSRWFTRGWTLQELLAPDLVEFFCKEGIKIGDKSTLRTTIHEITGIPIEALRGDALSNFSVEERLSWAAGRQTKRREDKAYCLLGIFQVFMPLLYGEEDYAFQRLRQKIERKHKEQSTLDHYLSLLPVATEAAFNSLNNQHEPTCLPNTRTELLHAIESWVESDDERPIYWLNGIAGTGKSTIARTIARTFHDRNSLGGSFFFSKGGGDLCKANKMATTLARQLAARMPEAKRHICEAIAKQEDIVEQSIRDQWQHLIIEPLAKVTARTPSTVVLLVLDALDECGSENDIRTVLRVLISARLLTNIRLRILITSRPLASIRYGFNKTSDVRQTTFVLHEVPHEQVTRDVMIFFEDNFSTIREERGFDEEWPGRWIIKRLVEISCGLFIWAATACRFIYEGRRLITTRRRLDSLINRAATDVGPEKQLDMIYTTVLQDFMQQDTTDAEEKEESYAILRDVLAAIVNLCSPLPMEPLARLIDRPLADVKDTLEDLHTIINVPSQISRPIRLHHPTFRDFLLNKQRCIDEAFWIDGRETHKKLGDQCLNVMRRLLKQNICGLNAPGAAVKDLDPQQIELCIPPDLQYACLNWVEHYRQSGVRLVDHDDVDTFFRQYFLNWLEVVNLIGKSAEMGSIIRLYHSLLMPDYNVRQIPFVKDARRLIFNFHNIIKQAPLQVYCAAIAFIPSTNELRLHFQQQRYSCFEKIHIAEANRQKPKDDFNYVSDLAFTPNSTHIASGSNFPAVRMWNLATRATVRKYEAASKDKMSSVAISSDGSTLAGGSDDFTVMAWNLISGALIFKAQAHHGWVNSVAFSPAGRSIVSGSMDETFALWNTTSGQQIKRVDNASSSVNSATFGPEDSIVATGAVDELVRVWNISGEAPRIDMLLDGHTGPVNAVRFSRNGKQIISGSDDATIRIWNSATGAEQSILKGHAKKVMAVAFSSDTRYIASGSEDRTVKVWNTSTGALLATLEDHNSGINAVQFSPDDTFLASSSYDDEVRIWDPKTWDLIGKLEDFEEDKNSGLLATQRPYVPDSYGTTEVIQSLPGHSNAITCIKFSPDGLRFASGSKDSTIKIWDGVQQVRSLEEHSEGITDVVFSPDSQLLTSTSADKTLRLWNFETGMSLRTFKGHSGAVITAIFSSDGRLLASCSTDGTVRVWDPQTGFTLKILDSHSNTVSGIAFMTADQFLVSWSTDATIIISDVTTMKPCAILDDHVGPINSVACSSDGQLLVSASGDSTVKLWKRDGELITSIESGSGQVNSVALSTDKHFVAFSPANGTIVIWDIASAATKGVLEVDVTIRTMHFSACGRYIETNRGTFDIQPCFSPPLSPPSALTRLHPYTLSVSQNWLRKDMQNILWLPKDYHAEHVAIHESSIVMGHASGSLTFVNLQ